MECSGNRGTSMALHNGPVKETICFALFSTGFIQPGLHNTGTGTGTLKKYTNTEEFGMRVNCVCTRIVPVPILKTTPHKNRENEIKYGCGSMNQYPDLISL
jgi:hypothetical protein